MNKTIFQIGLLAFCIATVVFGTQGLGVIETVSRSFIVFMVVVCSIAVMLVISSAFAVKPPDQAATPGPQQNAPSPESGSRRAPQAATQSAK
jgi:cation transporter-like permease